MRHALVLHDEPLFVGGLDTAGNLRLRGAFHCMGVPRGPFPFGKGSPADMEDQDHGI